MNSTEILELPSTPNIKFVQDGHGRGWYCSGGVSGQDGLELQGCVRADQVEYDRGFGG